MSSLLFNLSFYSLSIFFAVPGAPLALLPSPKPLRTWIFWWSRAARFIMKHVAGITIEIRGQQFMPQAEAVIIAAKHHSFMDAIILYSEMPDIAAVAMAELKDVPFVGLVFAKLGMIMVDRQGGNGARHLASGASRAMQEGRPILIYPEGHIPEVGVRVPYKKGVWHLQKTCDLTVVPVATNLGLRWSQNKWAKTRGHAVVEFLAPIAPGQEAGPFMHQLETCIEQRTAALLEEAGFVAPPLCQAFSPANLALTVDV